MSKEEYKEKIAKELEELDELRDKRFLVQILSMIKRYKERSNH